LGKKKSSSTSTVAPPAWAVPIIQGGANDLMNTYTSNQGNLQSIESGITGSTIPGIQGQIAQQGQQLQPGYGYINSTLSPDFLNTGQAQAQALGNYAGQQAGNSINAAFSSAGRTGSDNHATDLARGVTQAELAPMLQNLQYNEGIQQNAAGMLPGYSSSQFAGYAPLLGAQQLAGQLPYYGSSTIGQIGSLLGNYGTTTGTQPGGWGNDLLSAGLMAASFL
jgi:hypothetical protein